MHIFHKWSKWERARAPSNGPVVWITPFEGRWCERCGIYQLRPRTEPTHQVNGEGNNNE